VLDAMIPGLDGFAVCHELRAKSRWAPILMLTARSGLDDRVRGLDAGADDYLTKPFAFSELAARLRALVRRGSTERPVVLRVGDLALDPASKRVTRAGDVVALSTTEFALLELMMRHPGQVLSRTRILDHVWDIAYNGTSNVVDQYIAYLRRKIDKPYRRDDIETVRGSGYRLRSD
jgi:two-component system OmpR family response regulator